MNYQELIQSMDIHQLAEYLSGLSKTTQVKNWEKFLLKPVPDVEDPVKENVNV